MADYSSLTIIEAAQKQIVIEFISALKLMDPEIAARRLSGLLFVAKTDVSFTQIAAQFNALALHQTSCD